MKWTPPKNWEMMSPELYAEFAWTIPCALIHDAGAECAKCNPRTVGGYSASPSHLAKRLEVARQLMQEAT